MCTPRPLPASGRSFISGLGPFRTPKEVCMARADKATAVADIAEQFRDSTATVITDYRGLTVANLAELRRSLAPSATYSVAKNTLIRRAASEAGIEGLGELVVGPTAT